ncbi:MAG: Gfo/Idh/MocA family oxidoreductase, partial [Planctomycetia bacterium]|nr:Gfo/Idh/MocA family oxidoreductase [Planctomycetia bacterium]
IGVGRQGSGIFHQACGNKDVQAICTCDVFLPRARQIGKSVGISEENVYTDYRKVLERKDVDAILTATPEHWRSLICVNAALAGKHIYAEKPMSLTVSEGRLMVRAARKMNVVFQVGSMQRSMRENRIGCEFILNGGLGKIKEVVAANYESPWLCTLPGAPVPEGLDWDMWCGPTEPVPYHPELFIPRGKPGWLSFRPYSGGEMTGWGTHGLDQIQVALGLQETGPVKIHVDGEKLVPLTYDTPESSARGNRFCSNPRLSFTYANGITVYLGKKEGIESNRGGAIFFGEKAKMEIFRANITTNPREMAEELLKNSPIQNQNHVRNWLDCIWSGERPTDDCEYGHRTASLCHILNIARYVGRSLEWDPVAERFVNDNEANTYLVRKHRKGYELPTI